MRLYVEQIEEVPWAVDAFDQLALSSTEKDLLLALSESSVRSNLKFTDFVHGKGGDLIAI